MKIVTVDHKKDEKQFLRFRKDLYQRGNAFIDNSCFMIREVFRRHTSFLDGKEIWPLNVIHEGRIVSQGIVVYAKDLPEYIQLCFLESLPDQPEAVQLLADRAAEIGRQKGCRKLVAGLNGHVNYGLGFLCSHYDAANSFSGAANPPYYHTYLKAMDFTEVRMHTYVLHSIDNRLEKYRRVIDRLDRTYTYRTFDKKRFREDAKIYTDLNNKAFSGHRYYYRRTYREDLEMLKELFLFMKEDSLIFAFQGEKPVGFILWYPDFNELAKKGETFGAKHFIKNILFGRRIKTALIMEDGILEENRRSGLALGLIHQVFKILKNYPVTRVETSWVLEENKDSDSFCQAICDSRYKDYVTYEKDI
ncbi:MAG: hypothetical protein HFH91_08140 [Lachnospiraceae bacterium]|nr:hypothetical protein [Lachnospiraceae bacterium]